MTATDDPTIPDRGDRVLMVGGQFKGQRGTLIKRNGSSASVVLYPPSMRAVRTPDGRWWAVSESILLPLCPVHPAAEFVVRDE